MKPQPIGRYTPAPSYEELQAEIERLRALADRRGEIAVDRRREIERLRLTDAEREAVRVARDAYADDDGNAECEEIAAVLSGLLERTE